jgi:uncharacterized protein (UPF0305 family)
MDTLKEAYEYSLGSKTLHNLGEQFTGNVELRKSNMCPLKLRATDNQGSKNNLQDVSINVYHNLLIKHTAAPKTFANKNHTL